MIPLDSFVGQSTDGKMVPIIPGGNSIPLTFSNRKEYVERAIEYRLHEMDRQVRGSHERFESFAFWCMSSWCWLICIYISVPIQRLFRPYLRVCSLLKALGEPWIGQCLAWRPSPRPGLQNPPSYSHSSSVFFVFMSYCPPAQCPAPAQSGSLWMNSWRLALWSHEGLFPLGL